MKAVAVFEGERAVRVIDQEPPPPVSPTQVLLRMLEVGVCGTDREICSFAYGTPPAGSDRLVLGHESLGEVVEVGASVSRFKPGDLAVLTVRRPCPHAECAPCRAGRQDFCITGDFTERGIRGAHGFMTERVADEEPYVIPVPRALSGVAVLVEPLTIAEKALLQVEQLEMRLPAAARHSAANPKRAVVLGAGPVGLLGAMVLRNADYQTFVYSRAATDPVRASVMQLIGATLIPAETHTVEQLAERVGSMDLVYEAVGASGVAFEALKFLGVNGTFVFTGVPGRKAPVRLDTDRIMRHLVLMNQLMLGTVNAGRDAFEGAIRDLGSFMQRWPSAVRALITSREPMARAPELLLERPGGIKTVIAIAPNA